MINDLTFKKMEEVKKNNAKDKLFRQTKTCSGLVAEVVL